MIDLELVPPHIKAALDRYAEHHEPRGEFLTAVLSNDLGKALGYADDKNLPILHSIWGYVHLVLPGGGVCHGSPEIVKAWLASKNKPTEPA